MRRVAVLAAAGLLTIPLNSAIAQVPSGNTGLGDARAQNQPTSRGIPGAHHGHLAYGHPRRAGHGRHDRHHYHRHWH
jgi:hypothetical protein